MCLLHRAKTVRSEHSTPSSNIWRRADGWSYRTADISRHAIASGSYASNREPGAIESVPLRKLIAPAIFLVFTSTTRERVNRLFVLLFTRLRVVLVFCWKFNVKPCVLSGTLSIALRLMEYPD
ncbi:hypothetical protein Pla52n_06510 [Stieleria varia]|uniref:Uncharacterized protein n=1 Tax=Stieleria varia TaxID=2528005 RepID=A0A5C6B7Z1_9BACT|nr:hypothetical protein Pla52n_06510 [Stieleria varia]